MSRFPLRLRNKDAAKAVESLGEILEEPFSIIVRDATIQRFEYTFEAIWKLLKEYLREREGLICNSPKSCFREAFSAGLLTEDETVQFLEMTDDRNMTTHIYKEEISQILYGKIPTYYRLMELLLEQIKDKGI
ncbi:MAG: HI0074 family nucleotidyltransferase substrate-binding subunit [bacterium]